MPLPLPTRPQQLGLLIVFTLLVLYALTRFI